MGKKFELLEVSHLPKLYDRYSFERDTINMVSQGTTHKPSKIGTPHKLSENVLQAGLGWITLDHLRIGLSPSSRLIHHLMTMGNYSVELIVYLMCQNEAYNQLLCRRINSVTLRLAKWSLWRVHHPDLRMVLWLRGDLSLRSGN